jgi:hypothetical protein
MKIPDQRLGHLPALGPKQLHPINSVLPDELPDFLDEIRGLATPLPNSLQFLVPIIIAEPSFFVPEPKRPIRLSAPSFLFFVKKKRLYTAVVIFPLHQIVHNIIAGACAFHDPLRGIILFGRVSDLHQKYFFLEIQKVAVGHCLVLIAHD